MKMIWLSIIIAVCACSLVCAKTWAAGTEGDEKAATSPNTGIPKIIIEHLDPKTGKYPSEMTAGEKQDYENRKKEAMRLAAEKAKLEAEKAGKAPEANVPPTVADFKMDTVEFVSVDARDPAARKMTVKGSDGKLIELNVPQYITVTKTLDISELKKDEKVEVHYMVSKDKNEVISIMSGGHGMQRIPGMPQMPGAAVSGTKGKEVKGQEGAPAPRGLEVLKRMLDTGKDKGAKAK